MTSNPIEPPRKGDHMRASWGASVADSVNTCVAELADLRGTGVIKSRRKPDFVNKNHFHFKFSKSTTTSNGQTSTTYTIGEGAVQIGGYTYFAASGNLATDISSGTFYVCAKVTLSNGGVAFAAYSSTSALQTAQADHDYYIFPLYKTTDGTVTIDYRPMPNAGSWEIAESVSNNGGGTS